MTFPFRSQLRLALLALPLALTVLSCSKKEDPAPTSSGTTSTPAATTGTITGTLNPVGLVTALTINSKTNGQTFPATLNPATGVFSAGNLPADTYFLIVSPRNLATYAGYITVTAGQTTALGKVQLWGSGAPKGTVSWKVNGQTYTATQVTGSIDSNYLSVMAVALSGNQRHELSLALYGTSPYSSSYLIGTYEAYYRVYTGTHLDEEYATLTNTGTCTFTKYDENARIRNGGFRFGAGLTNGTPVLSGTSGEITVTNGTFSFTY